MRGTVSIRGATSVALGFLAILFVASCGEERNPALPVVAPTPMPRISRDLGIYTLTMTAGAACALPDYAARHVYENVRLFESAQGLYALFDPYDPEFVTGADPSTGFARPSGFTGTRDGDAVRFTLTDDESVDYSFVHLAAAETELAYSGTASGRMSDGTTAATFTGSFMVRSAREHAVRASCDATDHHMELKGTWPWTGR